MKKLIVLVTCLLVVGFLIVGCGKKDDSEKVTTLKLAHGLDTTHPVHKGMEYMAKLVLEKSGGKLKIDIYPSEQLGSERECIEQLQIGALAMTKTSTAALESFVPEVKVLGLPYLFRNDDHYWKVLLGDIGKELMDAGMSKGLKGLCFYDAGARSFYAKKPIKTPADLVGLKVRVIKSNMAMKMIKAMGGSATPIDWGELYTSLQQGVVDAAENNPPSFQTSHHYDVCKYYTLDEHTRPPDLLLISNAAWNKLSPEFQQVLQAAADESVTYQRKLWAQKVEESLKIVKDAGVEVSYPDKGPFKEAVKSLWDEFEGTELMDMARRIEQVK